MDDPFDFQNPEPSNDKEYDNLIVENRKYLKDCVGTKLTSLFAMEPEVQAEWMRKALINSIANFQVVGVTLAKSFNDSEEIFHAFNITMMAHAAQYIVPLFTLIAQQRTNKSKKFEVEELKRLLDLK